MNLGNSDGNLAPIIQYWHSPEAPVEVAKMVATFGDLNPGRKHLLFDETEAERFIGERFGGREADAFRSCAVPAMQADYFRNCAVLALGGVYADVDLLCHRRLDSLIETAGGGLLFENSECHVQNNFFAFPVPGHPLLQLALEATTQNIERRIADEVHVVTGPWVLSGLALLHAIGLGEARRHFAGRRFERIFYALADAAGDHRRLSRAFEGVRIAPFETALQWVEKPIEPPRYKEESNHWINWHAENRPIFR